MGTDNKLAVIAPIVTFHPAVKSALLVLVGSIIGAGAVLTINNFQGSHTFPKSSSTRPGTTTAIIQKPDTSFSPPQSAQNVWMEYQRSREMVLRGDSQLADQYRALAAKAHEQQVNVEATMEKVDPKVVPILAKLRTAQPPHSLAKVTSGISAKPNAAPAVIASTTLTPADWDEIHRARIQAFKTNPELAVSMKEMQESGQKFQEALNAAILKRDPQLSSSIGQFGPRIPPAPTSKIVK